MTEKLINTRIALRIDTLANWSKTDVEGKGAKLVLKRGEIGLCEIPSGNAAAQTAPTVLFKVGDGTTPFGELKWASALAADVYSWAKADDVVLENEAIKFKKGTEVVKSIDLSKFALNSELSTAISDLQIADAALGKRIDDVIAAAYDDTAVRDLITAEESARKAADQELDGKIATAQAAAETAQSEVDALEGVVSALKSTVTTEVARVEGLVEDVEGLVEDIEEKIGEVAEGKTVVGLIGEAQAAAERKVTELANGQVTTNKEAIEAIETDYLKGADKAELTAAIAANTKKIGDDIATAKTELQGYADGKASAVQTNLTNHINAYNTKVQELADEDARIAGLVATEKSRAETKEAELNSAIATEKSRAEGVEGELRTAIANINTNIASGLHFRGVFESTSKVENPVDGDICIVGNVEYIYSDGWKELGNAEAHATYEYVNTELAKKVDKSTYETKVAELVAEDADIRVDFAAADASLKSELEGKINGKVAQGDFDALEDRVDGHDTAIAGKVEQSVYNTFVSEQATVDAEQDRRLEVIETSLATGGTINDLIVAAQTQADKGVADAAKVQGELNTLAGQIGTISGKTLVEQLAAVKATADAAAVKSEVEASIAAINAEVAKKATIETVNGIDGRLSTAEGKITVAEGNITTLQGQVSALEGRYTDAKVEERIAAVVATEESRATAAEAALGNRIKVYEDKFGDADALLVFNCGDSVTNI